MAFRQALCTFSEEQTVKAFREVQHTGLLLDHLRTGASEMCGQRTWSHKGR